MATRKKTGKSTSTAKRKAPAAAKRKPVSARELLDLELRQVDVVYFVEPTQAVRRALKQLNDKFGGDGHRSLARGSVLATDESAPYYLHFHVDKDDELLLVHLIYLRKPGTPPPSALEELRESGVSIESVIAGVRKWSRKVDSFVITARATIDHPKGPVPIAGTRESAVVDERVFELAGAEFRAKTDGDGLRRFAWRELAGGRQFVEFSHLASSFAWDSPWASEEQQCRVHLEMIGWSR